MNQNTKVVNYVTQMEVEEIFLRDFPHKSFAKAGYTIVQLKSGSYGIVKNGNLEEIFTKFDKLSEIENIKDNIYLLYLKSGLQKLVIVEVIVEERAKVVFSKVFKEIKKVFKEYILVELENGKRALMDIYRYYTDLEFIEWEEGMCASRHGNSTNHAILKLPNGKYTILTKDGLKYSVLEFESVYDFFDEAINDIFRIVIVEKGREVLVRISDLRVSNAYYSINYYSYGYGHYSRRYVKVHSKNSKYDAILRVSDLEVSKEYEKLLACDKDFALFEENGESNILRLADFKEAKWEDD